MPIYCYKCPRCDNTLELQQSYNADPPICDCDDHDPIEYERDYNKEGGVGAQFRGSGFHATDYDTKEGVGR